MKKAASETKIKLNNVEQDIFSLLMDVVREKAPGTILRVAGGWVRDKLLGKDSHDIDIAVDNMSGGDFANLVSEYMIENGLGDSVPAVVKSNPEKSKHLDVGILKVLGVPIDFVNLRNEIYNDSRVPEITSATPEEDAKRRDLTINSLFYNINEGKIEDFVGGIEDLKNRKARTPVDSMKTFMDDPLRILRAVRFAAKYNLELDEEIIRAAKNPAVIESFKNKLSNERIWGEIAGSKEGDGWKLGALIGPNPKKATQLLKDLGLLKLIFDLTSEEADSLGFDQEFADWDMEQDNPHHEFDLWNHTYNVVKNLIQQTPKDVEGDHETYLVRNIAALLHDIGKRYKGIQGKHQKGHTTYHGHEETSGLIAEKVLQRLRAPNHIVERVKYLVDNHLVPHRLVEEGSPKAYRKFTRKSDDWGHLIDLSIADNLGKKDFTPEEIEKEIEKYEALRSRIQKAIDDVPAGGMTRPINGKDLMELGMKPGPQMKVVLTAVDEALLENPHLTKEEAIDIVKKII